MSSTLDAATGLLGRALGLLERFLQTETGPKQLLADLGWTLPQGVDDIGLAALDVSAVVAKLSSVNVAIATNAGSLEIDAQYADLLVEVAHFLSELDGIGATLNAPGDFLVKTNVAAELPLRLVDFLVVQLVTQEARLVFELASVFGIFELAQYEPDPTIYQSRHLRCTVHWERIPRVFSDPKGLLKDIYLWGTAQYEPETLTMALGALLQVLSVDTAVRPLPRRVEELLSDAAVPEADTDPATQVFINVAKGLGVSTVDAGVSLYGMRSTTPGGTDAGLGITPFLNGTPDLTFPISSRLSVEFDASLDLRSGLALVVRGGSTPTIKSNLTSAAGVADAVSGHVQTTLHYREPSGKKLAILSISDGFGLEATEFALSGGANISGGVLSPTVLAQLEGGHFFIDGSQMDSFLAKIIPISIDVNFDFGVGWSGAYGFFFEGSASPTVTIGVHESLGPFTLDTVHVGLDIGQGDTLPIELSLSGKGDLGPFKVSVDRIGMNVAVAFHRGNLGPADLSLAFKPPNGLGMELDAGLISGGGYLYIDTPKHRYAGILECSIADLVQVKIIGVLDTVLPDGTPEFSLLLVITTEFPPVQLSFGFTLNGVGGVGGVNRTMSTDALRAGFRAHQLNSVLFPSDPIDNAPQIISDLSGFFPPADGRYIFGPMFELGWGTPTLITLSVGVILEIPDPIKIVILGEIKLALPTTEAALIELNIDVLGIIDFGAHLLTIQGSMYDSRVLVFSISGDMGLMLSWGDDPNFAFSVGGLNPRFEPPPNFPQLSRCCVSIGDGDNPRLSASTYFAVTSNSAQFGANVDLYAAAGGLSIHGWIGFDALFIFSPFSFLIDFSAGLDIAYDGDSLASIHVDGMLAGPRQWHVHGDASFHILFIDISASVDLSWGDTDPVALPPVNVLPDLEKAFANPQSWSTKLPSDATPAISLAPRPPGDTTLVVDPMGTLEAREKVVPLGQTITKYGNAKPADGTLFTISSVTVNGKAEAQHWLTDMFAIGQYTDLSDDKKLTAPSYQQFTSGIAIGSSDVDTSRDVQCVIAYQDGYIDGDDTGMRLRQTYLLPLETHLAYSRLGAGFVSATRTKGVSQFTPPGTTSAVTTSELRYAIASTEDLSLRSDILATPVTQFEAQSTLRAHLTANPADRGSVQVVAINEVAA